MLSFALTAALSVIPCNPDPWLAYAELQRRQSSYAQKSSMDVVWTEDSKGFYYRVGSDWTFQDVASGEERPAAASDVPEKPRPNRLQGFAPRGQSYRTVDSPNGEFVLKSDAYNVSIEEKATKNVVKVTEDGSEATRIQYGAVSWVYGEEWAQKQALGWSPDGKRFWYYRFDNSPVKPFYLLSGNDKYLNGVDALDYPKAGDPNPKVQIWAAEYPSLTKRLVATTDDDKSAYLFDIQWSADSNSLYFQRADRHHHQRQVVSWNALKSAETVVLTESNPEGWVHGTWQPGYPTSGNTSVVTTEANGFFNFARLNFETGAMEKLTNHEFEVDDVSLSKDDRFIYTAYTGSSQQFRQLFAKVGKGAPYQVTDSKMTHQCWVSPNGDYALDVSENPCTPRSARLFRLGKSSAKVLRNIAAEPLSKAAEETNPVEMRMLRSADGEYDLLATISRPANNVSSSPVIFDVYNGPESVGVSTGFQQAHPWTALGFTIIRVESRGGDHRGRKFRNEDYGKLGITEIDDIAGAAKALCTPEQKVGIQGTSYGGYVAALSILRYPDIFQASVACSSVTDYRHYDTIYTERFMGLPSENKEGYDAGSCATYAKNLKGDLMLYFGLRDDNVHPNNSLQLIEALRREGKYFNVMVGPNAGHTYVGGETALRFFGDHLGNPIPAREGTL